MKKLIALLLAGCCVLGVVGGCSNRKDRSNMTKISVQNYNGGVGRQWLDDAAERFEEAYKDVSFADGKTGVYVEVSDGDLNPGNIAKEAFQVYVTSGANMNVVQQAKLGVLYDMTDIATDTTREGGSIDSIIFADTKRAFVYDDKYYGLPHYALSAGVSYDRELFDEQCLYFAADDETDVDEYTGKDITITGNFIGSIDAEKSVGLDGIADTEDDGLPRSLEEFVLLMDYIKNEKQIAPIMVSGKYQNYIQYLLKGFTASLAGSEQMKNYYNCTGEIEIVDGYTNEDLFPGINYIKKPIVKKVTLTEEDKNGYLATQLAAKYYALALSEIIVKEGYFSDDASNASINHYDAQKCLIYQGAADYKKVAMLIEGSYWYNEAKKAAVLDSYVIISGDKDERDVRWMTLPTSVYTDNVEEGVSPFYTTAGAQIVINANIKGNTEAEQACAAFVKFLYSDEELRAFTVETGCFRGLKYELTEEEIGKLPTFYQSLWRSRKTDGSNSFVAVASTETGLKVASTLSIELNGDGWNGFKFKEFNSKTTKDLFVSMQTSQDKWLGLV